MALCRSGHEVADDATFCPVCGARMGEKRKCPNGHEVASEATFCPVCGARLARRRLRWPTTLGAKVGAVLGVIATLVAVILGARQIANWLFPPPKVSAVFVLVYVGCDERSLQRRQAQS